jgi:arsenite methyltransferase
VKLHENSGINQASAETADSPPDARRALRETYGNIATGRLAKAHSCCMPDDAADAVAAIYAQTDTQCVTQQSKDLSLACGDSVALVALEPGQTVLDLGSGGGMDCFLAAAQVGKSGFVIGVDMTPEMLEKARAAQQQMGVRNVEFRLGEIEHLPVADGTIDVVLSNCVINLAPDKAQVFREAYRVLKPGGVLAVSDMMIDGPLPEAVRAVLGALAEGVCAERDYLAAIEAAGFVDIEVVRRDYPHASREEVESFSARPPHGARAIVRIGETGQTRAFDIDPAVLTGSMGSFSGKVRARKPM